MKNSKPMNILLLMTDQQRNDHVGYLPGARMETPNIDRIAEGTAFSNCVTVNPICTPARTALITGKYTHQIGTLNMSGDLSLQHPTFMQTLQRKGYFTAGIGKFHFLQGWPWGTKEGCGHNLVKMKPDMQRLGYDYVWEASGKQLASRNWCDYMEHLDKKGLAQKYRDHVAARGGNSNFAEEVVFTGKKWPFDTKDYVDCVTGDVILDCLKNRPKNKPFYLFGSFCGPHAPFDPPKEYLEQFDLTEDDDFIVDNVELSDKCKKRMYKLRRAYKAMIKLIDDQIGRILDYLESTGELDNTLILFTTDHGEMMGDHGLAQKSSFYRQAMNIPCAVRHPEFLTGRINQSPVEIIDLCATILDAAGIDAQQALAKDWPAFNDIVPAKSLLPIIKGEKDRIRQYAFSECRNLWQAIQSDDYKYVRLSDYDNPDYPNELLFDTNNDPDETNNLSNDDSYKEILDWHRRRRNFTLDKTPPCQYRWAPTMIEGEKTKLWNQDFK